MKDPRLAGPDRIVALDVIRGIACLLVFWVHFHSLFGSQLAGVELAISRGLANAGVHSVELFFVLSGYFSYQSIINRRPSYKKLFARRAQRLYPVFLLMFVMYVAVSIAAPSFSKLPDGPLNILAYLIANLLFLPGVFPILPLITVAWTLSYELAFFLMLPLIVEVLRFRERTPAWRMWFSIIYIVAHSVLWALKFIGHIEFVMFAGGVLLFELLLRFPSTSRLLKLSPIFMLIVGLWASRGPYPPEFHLRWLEVICLLSGWIMILATGFREGGRQRDSWFNPVAWLGGISYSFYLTHGFVLHGVKLLTVELFPVRDSLGVISILLLVSILACSAAASLVYYCVERPFYPKPSKGPVPVTTLVTTAA